MAMAPSRPVASALVKVPMSAALPRNGADGCNGGEDDQQAEGLKTEVWRQVGDHEAPPI